MAAEDKGAYLPAPPFPGYSVEEWWGEDTGFGQPEDEEEVKATEETPAEPKPIELSDDSLVLDTDGQAKPWKEIKAERLRQADYTRKTQQLAEERKKLERLEAYQGVINAMETSPALRNDVREALHKRLGIGRPAETPKVSTEEFDEDPAGSVNKIMDAREQRLRAEIEQRMKAQADQQRQAEEDRVADLLLQDAFSECGEHEKEVRQRVYDKSKTMPPDEYERYDNDRRAMRRLVLTTYRELLQEKEGNLETQPAPRANRAAPTPTRGQAVPTTPPSKSWWDVPDEKFIQTVNKTRGVGS